MSFVTTLPEEMSAAATQLETIGQALAAQAAAVLAPTTTIAPAGTDPVSQIQAALFATYGNLYQSISKEADAIHQQLVQTLGQNAGSYQAAEASNQASASLGDAFQWFLTNIVGVPSSGSTSLLSGNAANIGNIGIGNWASAMSDVIGLAGGGLLDFPEEAADAAGGLAGLASFDQVLLAGAVGPAGAGAVPVAAGMAGATTVGTMSVPPSWAGAATAAAASPVRLAAATSAVVGHGAGMGSIPAAMLPMAGTANSSGSRFGNPRYGLKPKVAPTAKNV